MRVRVPFGRQQLIGVIVELASTSSFPADKLRRATEVLDTAPVFDSRLLELLRWTADYYHHPIGEVLAAALPKLARDGAPAVAIVERWWITEAGATAMAAGEPKRAPQPGLPVLRQQLQGSTRSSDAWSSSR